MWELFFYSFLPRSLCSTSKCFFFTQINTFFAHSLSVNARHCLMQTCEKKYLTNATRGRKKSRVKKEQKNPFEIQFRRGKKETKIGTYNPKKTRLHFCWFLVTHHLFVLFLSVMRAISFFLSACWCSESGWRVFRFLFSFTVQCSVELSLKIKKNDFFASCSLTGICITHKEQKQIVWNRTHSVRASFFHSPRLACTTWQLACVFFLSLWMFLFFNPSCSFRMTFG